MLQVPLAPEIWSRVEPVPSAPCRASLVKPGPYLQTTDSPRWDWDERGFYQGVRGLTGCWRTHSGTLHSQAPATGSGSHGASAASDAGAAPAQKSRPRPLSRATPGPLLGRNLAGCRLGRKGPAFRHPSHRGHTAWGGEQVEGEPMAKDTQETSKSQKGNWRCHSLCLAHGRGRGYFSPWSEIPRCLVTFFTQIIMFKSKKIYGEGGKNQHPKISEK